MSSDNHDWMVVAIASIRRDIDEMKVEFRAAVGRLDGAQAEYAKKEYAARLVGRIAQRLVRISWYAAIAIGGYALTNWAKLKALVEGR